MIVFARAGLKLLVFSLIAWLVLGFALILTFKSARFKHWLQTDLSQRTGYEIRLTDLGVEFPGASPPQAGDFQAGQLHLTARRRR